MLVRYIVVVLLSALLFVACGDNVTNNYFGYEKTLVLISDNSQESEVILNIIGAVKKDFPEVEIVFFKNKDFDIFESGVMLERAVKTFPDNSHFAVIVDPSVNSKKIVIQARNRKILLPDNGSASRVLNNLNSTNIHYVDNINLFGTEYKELSEVPYDKFFRDAILNMLSDKPISSFGATCDNPLLNEINISKLENGVLSGQILMSDNFGNCETNINKELLQSFSIGDLLEINSNSKKFFAIFGTGYSSVNVGENVLFVNSLGRIEMSVNFGSLINRYELKSGDLISIKKGIVRVGILRYNSSDLVDNIIIGMKAEMSTRGFIEGKNILYFEKDAKGELSKLPNLVKELLSENINLMIPVSTPASQAAAQHTPIDIPIVYTYVTSPEFAGLIGKRINICGLSDATNFDDYLKFVKEIVPDIKIAGRIFNESEPNSAYSQGRFNTLGNFYDITYENQVVSSVQEIPSAFQNLVSKNINTILIAADNTLNLGFKDLSTLCISNKIILIGDSEENSEDGALASISVDYNMLSKSTGETAKNVILGKNPDDIPIKRFPTSKITLNKKTANMISYIFSNDLLGKASRIIE